MTPKDPKDPFLEGTFWDKSSRPIRSRALLFTPDIWASVMSYRTEKISAQNYLDR